MFRLFLKRKVFTSNKKKTGDKAVRRNRRISPRYPIDHKHLTLMNKQDILLIREISNKGFSVQVARRGFERFVVGDVYEARMRYLGELFDLNARVSWKSNLQVGFEITKADANVLAFLKRLLKPVEIANSLQSVEMHSNAEQGKSWFHGDFDTDLFIWNDQEQAKIFAWQFVTENLFVQWSSQSGIVTGIILKERRSPEPNFNDLPQFSQRIDAQLDFIKKQFVTDVFMAFPFSHREELLNTLKEE